METTTENVLKPVLVTFKHSGLTTADLKKPVKITANDTVALCSDGNAIDGILINVEADVCGVLISGDVTLEYSGSAPDLGACALLAAAAGKIKKFATAALTAGYQAWGFTEAKTGASASGLANDTTTYGAIIVIDGVAKEVSIVGSAAQTLTTVAAEIQTDIGAAGTCAVVSGKIRITSATTGAASTVRISDGNDSTDEALFATLTHANPAVDAAVDGTVDASGPHTYYRVWSVDSDNNLVRFRMV
ncbi:MAG: hypothetical protein HS115_11715 [Spirochaetales bacterium]|nr:hypothetical protein [Spirochaetales bacterium]